VGLQRDVVVLLQSDVVSLQRTMVLQRSIVVLLERSALDPAPGGARAAMLLNVGVGVGLGLTWAAGAVLSSTVGARVILPVGAAESRLASVAVAEADALSAGAAAAAPPAIGTSGTSVAPLPPSSGACVPLFGMRPHRKMGAAAIRGRAAVVRVLLCRQCKAVPVGAPAGGDGALPDMDGTRLRDSDLINP